MPQEKVEENLEIVRLRDEEGRLFSWIAKHLTENGRKISEKNVVKIYYREKAKQEIKKRRRN